MKWVTRSYVHLDRVASPWLIKRFIDKDAIFVFAPYGEEHFRPKDATAFAIPGGRDWAARRGGHHFREVAEAI